MEEKLLTEENTSNYANLSQIKLHYNLAGDGEAVIMRASWYSFLSLKKSIASDESTNI